MSMTYENMKIQFLPAGVVCDSFIKGIGSYSYEEYLVEYVNQSEFFRKKAGKKEYTWIKEQPSGECDCVSELYEIDFKRIASKTKLQACNLFSPQIHVENGWTGYGSAKVEQDDERYKPISTTILYAALRPMIRDAFDATRQNKTKRSGIEDDIRCYLENLMTDKNLFLFFPYNFFFDENDNFDLGLQLAIEGLNQDFRESLLYRQEKLPDKDTYFAFLYAHHLILLEWNKEQLAFIEKLPIGKSPLFMKLLDYCDAFGSGALK